MPLTRRIQVFISEELSAKYDVLLERSGFGPTPLIEWLIRTANPHTIAEEVRAWKVLAAEKAAGKLDSQPASSLDTKPRSKTAEEIGLKPCLVHHVIGCHMCETYRDRAFFTQPPTSCPHPAKARRGKKCLNCGETI